MKEKIVEKKAKEKKFNSKMQANLLLVFCVVILVFFILIFRIAYINVKDGERYEKKVLSQQSYVSNAIDYKRGEIVDRNLTKLATSEKVYNMILDPVAMLGKKEYRDPTIKAIISCFDITEDEINQILKDKKGSRYVVMKDYKTLTYEQVEPFRTLEEKDKNIKGVWFEEEYIRRYPLATSACQVVGFTSKGNVGIGGIEEFYNEELNGVNGREYGYFDSELNLERTVKAAKNGNTIVSTIDANVQMIVEKKIAEFEEEIGGDNVAVLIMNPQNGEILAMATNSVFDLNNPRDLTSLYTEDEIAEMDSETLMEEWNAIWRNFIISDAFEPGSTFKPFTVGAALDEAKATEHSTYDCQGYYIVNGQRIRCSSFRRGGHGNITLAETLMLSCNPAMMEMGEQIGSKKFLEYVKLFGFGSKTGIDLPGEGNGIIFKEDAMGNLELATSTFGQGQTVTMIQMVSAFSSVINGGYYYKPHVVKEILNENGATVQSINKVIVKETISKKASDQIRHALFQTVESGTAKGAKVEGYEIGGKTATAEKIGRDKKNYIVSFAGFAPLEEPGMAIYVTIDQPHVEDQAHSSIATEFASKIMKEVLPFLGIYPSTNSVDADTDTTKDTNTTDNVDITEDTDTTESLNTIQNTDTEEDTTVPEEE